MITQPNHQENQVLSRSEIPNPVPNRQMAERPRKRNTYCSSCFLVLSLFVILTILGLVFFVSPGRTNVLVLGIDSRENSNLGRSDTIILTTIDPSQPYIGMLSIPRDLWVLVPDHGPDRINTAHFYGEAEQVNSGPEKTMETIRSNFGVDVHYFVRLNHVGFLDLIDHLGGIDVVIDQPIMGLSPGINHLTGEEALALVRNRSGSDDFSRMQQGQIFIKAFLNKMIAQFINPANWSQIPETIRLVNQNTDSNVPIWLFPQYGVTIIRVGFDNIDSRIIGRDMVSPFVTSGGAAVLDPIWEKINPMLMDMFGQ